MRHATAASALVVALCLSTALTAQNGGRSGGNGTIYLGSYARSLLVIDESTLEQTGEIPLRSGIPIGLALNERRNRFYVRDATFEQIEVVDLETQRSVDLFSLSTGDKKVRIWGYSVDPNEEYVILLVKTYEKLSDRYEIGGPTLLRYDLSEKVVTDTIPWPDGQERDFMRLIFAPDGRSVYFFSDEIVVLETENFTEVDRWDLSQEIDAGMGRFNFGFPGTLYEEPGFYTGLFRITDPVQNRRLMGVARVNLLERDVDFYMLGPSGSVGFSLSPDRQRAYGLHQEVGNYQLWTFNLENRRVQGKVNFEGRPRMSLNVSTNGQLLYIANAGNTIDVYDAETFEYIRTAQYDSDMLGMVLLPNPSGN